MSHRPSIATRFNEALPPRIRKYLHEDRGIADYLIDHHLLGWNGQAITIPIFDREGRIAMIKLAKDPEDSSPGPKMHVPAASSPELYGWERVEAKPRRLIVCEGEFDRLVLESNGFGAVTSTGGAGVFRQEWADEIKSIPELYLCFDRDAAGRAGARRVAQLIPHAKIVKLPDEVGEGGDVTDFFVHLKRSREEFIELLEPARPLEQVLPQPVHESRPTVKARDPEIDRLKAQVPIEHVIGHYTPIAQSGQTFVGLCPFHDDRRPSLVVYPESRRFYCFGCGAHGDVIEFLMRMKNLRFPEALSELRRLSTAA